MVTPYGKHIRKIRIDRDMKMTQMAELMGVSKAYISSVENGRRRITEKYQELSERALNLSPDEKMMARELIAESQPFVVIRLDNLPDEGRKMVVLFSGWAEQAGEADIERARQLFQPA